MRGTSARFLCCIPIRQLGTSLALLSFRVNQLGYSDRIHAHFRLQAMTEKYVPDKEQINLLEPFDRLDLQQIELVATAAQAKRCAPSFASMRAAGF